MKKYYSTSLVFSVLVSINDANVLDLIKKNNNDLKLLESRSTQAQLTYERADVIYSPFVGFDVLTAKDNTDTVISDDKQDINQKKYTMTLGKNFLSGTQLNVEATQFDSRTSYAPNFVAGNFSQNYVAFNVNQQIFPNFFGSQDRMLLDTSYAQLQRDLLQNDTDQIELIKAKLANYWRAKLLKIQVDKNMDLTQKYEILNRKISQKSKNSLASPGELEQTQAEIMARSQSIQDDTANLNIALQQVREDLSIHPDQNLVISTEINPIPPMIKRAIKIEETQRFKLQQAKTEAAEHAVEAAVKSNWPELSLYGKYVQQGLEEATKDSVDEFNQGEKNKYTVGLKLNYTFGSNVNELNYKLQKQQYEIEKDKSSRLKQDLTNYFSNLSDKLKASFDNVSSAEKILKLRNDITKKVRSSYDQGRTDISILIDAYDKAVQAEINLYNAYSTYYQLLYEYDSQTK